MPELRRTDNWRNVRVLRDGFYDFANVELYKEGYLRMKIANALNLFKVVQVELKEV